ncbi:PTS lactose/cellobiose transporter subunit IIA [Paenibacillus polymyxa]|uniref:PTS lactose/cellobiose transporter subunit IIA n=1 Tax=Paenibacillus polymyxa TaxID=1406 RepID=UPI0025B6FC68|nr:PTS lactose/cellobiose transporter subunit IIA [Paenibacillus polymyxa]MDN4084534.1 PTS lactose/cellobiose transporter subunit IIA [Paenibacillus polymyxa]MDN4090165.1 PTS lactose/cellobiose transporter subunit IIA [Paenibacillus polymyxa]MDN4110832.1 PTS lactose/cellobiose transporter subunit IIA [Paenibacillus polymyxa]
MNDIEKQNELAEIAMQIILHSGNARKLIDEAFKEAKAGDFESPKAKMDEANAEIVEAHRAQTKLIQAEARGETHQPTILFNHAQDNLMIVASEMAITKRLIEILEIKK